MFGVLVMLDTGNFFLDFRINEAGPALDTTVVG